MSYRRKIHAQAVWLNKEDGSFRLGIKTRKGAYVDVLFSIDANEAMCAINQLAPVVATEIRNERARHERHRQKLNEAWEMTDRAIRGLQLPS